MIDHRKTLEQALKEIDCSGEHEVFNPRELMKAIDRIAELYLGEVDGNGLQSLGLPGLPPLIDFCDEITANILSANGDSKYHLWIGKEGYVFTAETARDEMSDSNQTMEETIKNLKRSEYFSKYPKFNAFVQYSSHGYWDIEGTEREKAVIFFDNPSNVSLVYFMKKIKRVDYGDNAQTDTA